MASTIRLMARMIAILIALLPIPVVFCQRPPVMSTAKLRISQLQFEFSDCNFGASVHDLAPGCYDSMDVRACAMSAPEDCLHKSSHHILHVLDNLSKQFDLPLYHVPEGDSVRIGIHLFDDQQMRITLDVPLELGEISSNWEPVDFNIKFQNIKITGLASLICHDNFIGGTCKQDCRKLTEGPLAKECEEKKKKVDAYERCTAGHAKIGKICRPLCKNECYGRGHCEAPNFCRCNNGWERPLCKECTRLAGCVHGTCSQPFECNCEEGWTGQKCDRPIIDCTEAEPCGPHGTCMSTANLTMCMCNTGFRGDRCEKLFAGNCEQVKCSKPYTCIHVKGLPKCVALKRRQNNSNNDYRNLYIFSALLALSVLSAFVAIACRCRDRNTYHPTHKRMDSEDIGEHTDSEGGTVEIRAVRGEDEPTADSVGMGIFSIANENDSLLDSNAASLHGDDVQQTRL